MDWDKNTLIAVVALAYCARAVNEGDKEHPLLNRQIVYTGITRAKNRAVILGTERAFRHAIETKVMRDTGIKPIA